MKIVSLLAMLFATIPMAAQENEELKHPIDVALQACLETPEGQSTAGMRECVATAAAAWDKEMNKYYNLLMKGELLKAGEKELLREAQRSWLDYRDKENKFSSATYFGQGGTMWHVIASDRVMETVKQRALDLKAYFVMLTME